MDKDRFKDPKLILAIIQALIAFGYPVIFKIADILKNKPDPTVEDIKALYITKPPEEYF